MQNIDSHSVNYSEITQDLLDDEENNHIERRNTDLILNKTEAIPEVTSGEDSIQIQTNHFATHSRENVKKEAPKENISHEPMIKRRTYLIPSL